jgi:hypothetical protein
MRPWLLRLRDLTLLGDEIAFSIILVYCDAMGETIGWFEQ